MALAGGIKQLPLSLLHSAFRSRFLTPLYFLRTIVTMIFYAAHLSVLGLSLVGATYCLRRSQPAEPRSQGEEVAQEEYGHDLDSEIDDDAFVQFRNQFLSVYIPAVAADWLQVCGTFTRLVESVD